MKPVLFAITFIYTATTSLFSQSAATAPKDSGTLPKIYFPAGLSADSLAFEKAMPPLAEKVLAAYREKNKRTYFENASGYYFLTGNYQKVIDYVDSVQKIDDDPSYGIDFKSYARAKLSGSKQPGSFNNDFKKEFGLEYNPLSFRKKVYIAFLDSATVGRFRSDYQDFKGKIKGNKEDSLSMEEATSLADKYALYKFYNEVFPMISPVVNAPGYREKFPAIKSYKWGGVAPVKELDEIPDPDMPYKLLMELTSFAYKGKDSSAKKEINAGLGEVARLINLHEANGIPQKNMNIVVVVHASALYALLNNEKYKKKYGVDNPNIEIIKELQHYGAKIVACGQAMNFLRLEKEDLVPAVKQALTAQTVLSSYQLKNYVYYDLSLKQ